MNKYSMGKRGILATNGQQRPNYSDFLKSNTLELDLTLLWSNYFIGHNMDNMYFTL